MSPMRWPGRRDGDGKPECGGRGESGSGEFLQFSPWDEKKLARHHTGMETEQIWEGKIEDGITAQGINIVMNI